MNSLRLYVFVIVSLLLVLGPARGSRAETDIDLPPFETIDFALDTGLHNGQGDEPVKVFSQDLTIPDATWLRLHFGGYYLGDESYIVMTSLADGSTQRLNAVTIEQWQGSSAFFNGDTLLLELYAGPGDENIFFEIERITVGKALGSLLMDKSLCDGDDDRVASTDSRVGRILAGGCTAFLVSNGAVLTAGHCVDFDPDDFGPQLPDGVLDLSGVVEFNVPLSTSSGGVVMADADDQYPIDTGSVEWNFDGEGQGFGKDWAVFSVFPNANNQDVAHVTRGFFRVTREKPAVNHTIRITGYGADDTPPGSTGGRNSRNKTEQTDTGPYKGESSSGGNIWHTHRADTAGASSGSPIIWESRNIVIGIHTNAGCTASGGTNAGTSFEHNPLETALDDFPGSSTVYVDRGMPALATEDGTVFRPYNTLAEGVGAVSTYGRVHLVEGYYPDETLLIDRAMTLVAPVGSVTIGE